MAAHGVDLIDEDDGGSVLLGLLKKVTDTGRAYAYEHFHEVGAGNGEEGNPRLSGYRPGQQRFTGTGRAYQKHTLRDPCTQFVEFLGAF